MKKCKLYRITFDIVSEPEDISRVPDIEHHLNMTIHPSILLPDSVSAKYVKQKVELIEEN